MLSPKLKICKFLESKTVNYRFWFKPFKISKVAFDCKFNIIGILITILPNYLIWNF